ncbi:hypothetical protein LPJ66_010216, partial [Kickxella alabastrina]
RHGRRARVLAVLSELRLLIQTQTEAEGDRSGRVFRYLDELNRLYVDALQADARPLRLRAGTSVALQQYRAGGEDGDCVTLAVGSSTRPQVAVRMAEYDRGRAGAPALLCSLYAKQELRQQRRAGANSSIDTADPVKPSWIDTVDPVKPSWIDYLVSDLAPAEARALFTLISRSKVPDSTSQLLRAAAEEALVFALNRHGAALEPLQSMRVCMYFLRRQCGHAQVRQLQRIWELAGDSIEAQQAAGSGSLGDLRFKRWNNVASQLLVFLSGPGNDVPGAWRLLAHWHTVWTRVMRRLCPVARRPDDAPDGLRFPYWRAKRPGVIRLHDLTLSSPAVTRLLAVLVRDSHMACALELLGIATSEAGVRLCAAPFNVLLRGISDRDALQPDAQRLPAYALPSLASQLPLLANSRALTAYALPSDAAAGPAADRPTAQMLLLLRAMMRWRLEPDACTLEIIVRRCCRAGDLRALCAALRLFAATWRVRPSEHCWRIIDEAGMYDDARLHFENKVEPLLLSAKSGAVRY